MTPATPAAARPAPVAALKVGDGRDAAQVFDAMTPAQRLGQVFMVGTPANSLDPATRAQVRRFHVGNVMLTGRSYGGVRPPARVAAALQARTTGARDAPRPAAGGHRPGGR